MHTEIFNCHSKYRSFLGFRIDLCKIFAKQPFLLLPSCIYGVMMILASFPHPPHFFLFFIDVCVCEKKYGKEGKLEGGNREKTQMAKI